MYDNIAYFVSGALTMFMFMMIDKSFKKGHVVKKRWTKVISAKQEYNVDMTFKEEVNAQQMIIEINEELNRKIKTLNNFKSQPIEAGFYSINALITLRFTQREDNEKTLN